MDLGSKCFYYLLTFYRDSRFATNASEEFILELNKTPQNQYELIYAGSTKAREPKVNPIATIKAQQKEVYGVSIAAPPKLPEP